MSREQLIKQIFGLVYRSFSRKLLGKRKHAKQQLPSIIYRYSFRPKQ